METIEINVGVYTPLKIDFTDYDFTGVDKVILTIKNYVGGEEIITREFDAKKEYNILITPEESKQLTGSPVYDFTKITMDGKTYKETEISNVILKNVVGEIDEQ